MTCPGCGQAAKFQGYRPKTPMGPLGEVRRERAYYCCGRCGHGLFPWDETVGLTPRRLTPGAERVVGLAGSLSDSFAEAAEKVLPELAGLRLCESTAERTTEDAGARLGGLPAEGRTLGPRVSWDWHTDAHGRTCAYVSVDATGVRQQGPGGGKAEGRMPYVGMVYNPVPETGPPTGGRGGKPCGRTTCPGCTRRMSWGLQLAVRRAGWAWTPPSSGSA